MRWHAEHDQEDGVMRHPSDALAWKHFNDTHQHFAVESRNVRLGLSTDGFQPFGQSGQQYSSWPVIITPYNLPPWMCMKEAYMFLTVIVSGPTNPKQKIDVYLQPLILELQHLWETSVQTYDVSLKQNFVMRAALMWTISDFRLWPCYPLEHENSFLPIIRLANKYKFMKNRTVNKPAPPPKCGFEILQEIEALGLLKVTEFEADEVNRTISQNFGWRKRSIFWDLPYWKTNMVRHNLDVMHIEKNMFDNFFNMIMNIEGKTKDNAKSRADLELLCRRHELHKDVRTGKYPKACYTLDKQQKERLCEWLKGLKFPYGYVSNLSRCVDMRKYKLFGMKSHDCHAFMQRLIPIAFRELLPSKVWEPLTELSLFFKSLTSSEINLDEMEKLENEIAVILCKLEGIFPPSLFDCMEHLPVHLPYEAKLAGPFQYRWMYPFERVEGSICNAYLVEEGSTFCGHYFEPHVHTRARQVPRNDDGGGTSAENPIHNKFIYDLTKGPLRTVNSYPVYFVNGYKYHTESHGHTMSSINSGVSIQGELMDYYGKIIEILEVEYPVLPVKRCVIFKCNWYDPTPNIGTKVHNRYNVVEINFRRRLRQFEPFILAMQARQVYYVPFPSLRHDKADWLAVCKVKPRGVFESHTNVEERNDSEAFQEDVASIHDTITCDDTEPLHDPSNAYVDILSAESDEGNNGFEQEEEFDSYSSDEEDDCNLHLSSDSN
ncbi:hypothetical protein K2173_004377 [Erythroxylum novogranatense]|uniref:DUF4218 domain-containing protein n=1 Tax=Erythroxylum novogranatense TaxID=1862640 RepID=A0AAV8T4C7_9ROSI|nr:hypothetical protein K2173_004377 [Erythroxylum novogranatense]